MTGFSSVLLQVSASPQTPVHQDDISLWAPFLRLTGVMIVAGLSVSVFLWFRGEEGWEVTPTRSLVVPSVVVATVFLELLNLSDLSSILTRFWPWLIFPAIHGAAIVVAASYKQRRWWYVVAFNAIIAIGTILASVVGLSGQLVFYASGICAGFGLIPGYLTARKR